MIFSKSEPIIFPTSLAIAIGVTNAICLMKLGDIISNEDHYEETFIDNGRRWVHLTYNQLHKQLPFLSEITIKRAIYDLQKKGIILTKGGCDNRTSRLKYYAIDHDALALLLEKEGK